MTTGFLRSETLSVCVFVLMVWLYRSVYVTYLCMKMALSVSLPQTACDSVTLPAFAAGLAGLVKVCANVWQVCVRVTL